MNRLEAIGIVFVAITLAGCTHTSQKTVSAPPAPRTGIERRLDQETLIYREGLSNSYGGGKMNQADQKRRDAAVQGTLYQNYQTKQFNTSNTDLKYFDTGTTQDLKMFPTKNADMKNSGLRDKTYPTTMYDTTMFPQKSYATKQADYQSKRYDVKKYGLRDANEWESKRVEAEVEPVGKLIRQQLGAPTKATEIGGKSVPLMEKKDQTGDKAPEPPPAK